MLFEVLNVMVTISDVPPQDDTLYPINLRAYRRQAIKYWEIGRVIYNLILACVTLIGYFPSAAIASAGDGPKYHSDLLVCILFIQLAIGANICYSFAYAIEFFVAGRFSNQTITLIRYGLFLIGTFVATVLALFTSMGVGVWQFTPTT